MQMALIVSNRSTDERLKVGTVIVTSDNTQMLSLGYNGNWSGGPNESESNEPGQSGNIHSEINALLKLDFNNPKKKIAYITLSPCRHCAKCLINAGISKIVFYKKYRDTSGLKLLLEAGIEVEQFTDIYDEA